MLQTPGGAGFRPAGDPDMVTIGVPRPPRRRAGRAAPLAGVAALALAGGACVGLVLTHSGTAKAADTAAIAASSPTASPSPSASGPAKGPVGRHGWLGIGPGRAGLGFGLGFGGMVHGQFTAPKAGGGYQTVDVQRGTVSAVSASSVTVKSADGFTATYAVTSATVVDAKAAGIGSVKQGDTVFVSATASGGTTTAANILDMTAVRAGRAAFGFPEKPPAMPVAPATP